MRRLDPTSLLVLAVGVAATLGLTAALGALAQVDGIASIQHSLHEHLLSIQLGPLDRPVTIATQIGDLPTVFGVAIGGGLALGLIARSAWPVVLLLVSVVVERWLQLGLISLVGGTVPAVSLGTAGPFPSGGVARAIFTYGLLAALATRGASREVRRAGGAIVAIVVAIEATTRIYLGRHWLLDVVGGALLGAGLLTSVLVAQRRAGLRAAAPDLTERLEGAASTL